MFCDTNIGTSTDTSDNNGCNIDTNKEDANILVDEAREAIKRLPKGKTTGCDDLSAKLIKLDSEYTISPDAVLLAADNDVGLVKPQQKASGKGKS